MATATRLPDSCPLCGADFMAEHEIPSWPWQSLAMHIQQRHTPRDGFWFKPIDCPCGFYGSYWEDTIRHLQSQDDLREHLALGLISQVGA